MRKQTLLLLATLAAAPVFAQSDDDKKPAAQPVENLYFSTDEYIAIPKFTFSYGYRSLTGSKASFAGTAVIRSQSVNVFTDTYSTLAGKIRVYNDGKVGADNRTDGNGHSLPSDGMTNNWSFAYDSQANDGGYGVGGGISFNSYSAQVVDQGPMTQTMGNSYGMEVTVSHDLPKLGRYLQWAITGGISLNDIHQGLDTGMTGRVTTVTDWYYLNGATAPTAPYSTPSNSSITIVDATGTTTSYTSSVTTTVLLPSTPDATNVTNPTITTIDGTLGAANGSLNSRYRIKGSYYTLRAGPTFIVPFSAKLHFSFSAGMAVIVAGSTYLVDNEFITAEKELITKSDTSYDTFVRPGYYLDANVEYWITERSGIFAGGIFQSTGNFTQLINNVEDGQQANYSTRVDLSSQMGMRLGMNIRF